MITLDAALIFLGLLLIARVIERGLLYQVEYNKESFEKSTNNQEIFIKRIVTALGSI